MHDAEKKESLAAENKRFFIMYFRLPEEEEGGRENFLWVGVVSWRLQRKERDGENP